jgi:hypothetical protein
MAHARALRTADYDAGITFWLLAGGSALAAVCAVVTLVIAVRIWTNYCPSSGTNACVVVLYDHSVWFYFTIGLTAAVVSLALGVLAVRARRS